MRSRSPLTRALLRITLRCPRTSPPRKTFAAEPCQITRGVPAGPQPTGKGTAGYLVYTVFSRYKTAPTPC